MSSTTMPALISVDDHLIEPPHLFESRLPAKYRDVGPRVVVAPRGEIRLENGAWVERPGTGDELAAWWHYEDHRYQLKLVSACPGLPPEEVISRGVTFEDIAPGCFEPKARDYPHQDGTFPHSQRVAEDLFGHLDADAVRKIARSNAIELFGLALTP